MNEYITKEQKNYGWGLVFDMAGKYPIVSKRIWKTLKDAQEFVDDKNSAAIAGLILRVVGDKEVDGDGNIIVDNNGAYLVLQAAGEKKLTSFVNGKPQYSNDVATKGELVKLAGESDFNNKIDKIEASVGLADDGSHIKTKGKYTSAASTVVGEIATLETAIGTTANTSADTTVYGAITKEKDKRTEAIKKIKESVGLTENLGYNSNTSAKYISGATTFNDADVKLNNAIAQEVTDRDIAITKLINGATDGYDTLKGLEGKIKKETEARTNAINELNSSDVESVGKYVSKVNQENGKVTESEKVDLIASGDNVLSLNSGSIQSTIALKEVTTGLGANVAKQYQLVGINKNEPLGVSIDIPKDTSLKSADFVTENDKGTIGQFLKFIYIVSDESTSGGTKEQVVYVDMSQLISESEVENGIQNVNHKLSIKIDTTSEGFLTTGKDGLKLSSVQNAIDAAKASATTTVAKDAQANTTAHLTITSATTNGHNEYTIGLTDVASATGLTAETNARVAQDDKIEASVGLADDGSHIKTKGKYTSAASTVVGEIAALDTELQKTNDAIAAMDLNQVGADDSFIKTISQANGNVSATKEAFDTALNTTSKKAPQTKVVDAAVKKAKTTVKHATSNARVQVSSSIATDGHIEYTITENDIAQQTSLNNAITAETQARQTAINNLISGADEDFNTLSKLEDKITAETQARKAIDGQTGQTYTANTNSTYISGATSLNDADIKLNNIIKSHYDNRVGRVYVKEDKSNGGEIFNNYGSNIANGNYSHAEGNTTQAIRNNAHAEGQETLAGGAWRHKKTKVIVEIEPSAEELVNYELIGHNSHAEGWQSRAIGNDCHAEGSQTKASFQSSHAEGGQTQALGDCAHSEGSGTTANAPASHSEGANTQANGFFSHASGLGTNANNYAQTAIGVGNLADFSIKPDSQSGFRRDYPLFSIGNGEIDESHKVTKQSDAFRINGYGDAWMIGFGGYDGTNANSGNTLQKTLVREIIVKKDANIESTLNKYNTFESCGYYHLLLEQGNNKISLGNLFISSDYMRHVINQTIISNMTLENGQLNGSHTDDEMYLLYRVYNLNRKEYDKIPYHTWSKWNLLTHNYLPISGGTIAGNLTVGTGSKNVIIKDGTITATGAIYSSDRNLKKDIENINNNAINSVKNIELKSYKFKDDETNRERYGVIAQELENSNLSNLVVEDSNGKKGVDYISFLILKIAQLEQEIKELKNR